MVFTCLHYFCEHETASGSQRKLGQEHRNCVIVFFLRGRTHSPGGKQHQLKITFYFPERIKVEEELEEYVVSY